MNGTFKVTIETGNAAFDGGWSETRDELVGMLRKLANQIARDPSPAGQLRDTNGNTVGEFIFTPAEGVKPPA